MKNQFVNSLILLSFIFSCKDRKTKIRSTDDFIYGSWVVTDGSLLPFDHPSFCNGLSKGSKFEFLKNGSLRVSGDNQSVPCNPGQMFMLDSNCLTISEYDMLFYYQIRKISNDTLIMIVSQLPEWIRLDPVRRYRIAVDSLTEEDRRVLNSKPELKLVRLSRFDSL